MRVFITGANGWIGSHVAQELLANGHTVLGLARSDASAARVAAMGADVLRGDLDDLDSLRQGAQEADAVVHLANKHDFAHPERSAAAERASITAIGEVLSGTGKALVVASGTAIPNGGHPLTEDVPNPAVGPDSPRGGGENLALDFVAQRVRTIVARFAPTVHGTGDHGFVAVLMQGALDAGAALVVDDGDARWSAVHVTDAARAVRLALDGAPAGTILHVAAEESIRTGDIAAAIARKCGLPTRSVSAGEITSQLGFVGAVFGMDLPASSAKTRELLGWTPTGPTLLEDLESGAYSVTRD